MKYTFINYMDKFDANANINYLVDFIKGYFVKNGPDSKAIIGISGGKDSTVAAALLVKALGKDRVLGVLMPNGEQKDINDSLRVCAILDIPHVTVNIQRATDGIYTSLIDGGFKKDQVTSNAVVTNTPARMRMSTLYAIAAMVGGRVVNTCNWSEDYVGWSTKFGDGAGDFSLFANYTASEVLAMGDALNLPADLVHKAPSDGMCGMTDEDKLGYTYSELDAYLLDGIKPAYETFKKIEQAHARNTHKLEKMPAARRARCNDWVSGSCRGEWVF